MSTQTSAIHALEDVKMPVNMKLAALWTSFMFLYIYVDYFHLYMPGTLEEIMHGRVFVFDITQGFILTALGLATIPIMMIFLAVALPARINRFTNIIVATFHIPYMLSNVVGETWIHMYYAAAVEVALLGMIIRYAWKWPTENR